MPPAAVVGSFLLLSAAPHRRRVRLTSGPFCAIGRPCLLSMIIQMEQLLDAKIRRIKPSDAAGTWSPRELSHAAAFLSPGEWAGDDPRSRGRRSCTGLRRPDQQNCR